MKLSLTLLLTLCLNIMLFAAAATGSAAPAIRNPQWIDGKKYDPAANKGKKTVVYFLLNLDQKGLIAISRLHQIYKACDDKEVAMFAVINGKLNNVKRFPGLEQLPFPVSADGNREIIPTFMRPFDALPLAVIVDKSGTLCWRGPVNHALPVIREVLTGKYNLKENIRVEKFSLDLSTAIRKKDYPAALKLIRAEWERNPAELELVSMMLTLCQKHLKQEKEAFAVIADAHRKLPGNFAVYNLEHQLITRTGKKELLNNFFDRAIAEFQVKDPVKLLSLAKMANQIPTKAESMHLVCRIFAAGWRNGKFKSGEDKGFFAIEYSKVMHIYGRPDLGLQLASEAAKLFKSGSKNSIRAAETAKYYADILKLAPTLKL